MKKTAIATAFLLLIAGSAMAQQGTPSAKFAATWTETPGLKSVVNILDATVDTVKVARARGYTLATIKVPQDKELMVGVSAEIGLLTETSIKGKNGGTATVSAGARGWVTVFAVPRDGGDAIKAEPGRIMLSSRFQELSATLGGVIQSCQVPCSLVDGQLVCEDIDISEDCVVTDEQIGLLQETTAAHHFNFILPNLNQGVYDIKAVFTTGARAEVDICTPDTEEGCELYVDGGTASGTARAMAIINKTMLTVQDVRAAKNGLIDTEIYQVYPKP